MNGAGASTVNEGLHEVTNATLGQRQTMPTVPITPELVRAVTEKVYVLWLLELKIEDERWRRAGGRL